MSHAASSHADVLEQTWQTLERLADDAARWAGDDLQPQQFYQRLLGRCVSALAAEGAAVWIWQNGSWELADQVSLEHTDLAGNLSHASHVELLNAVAREKTPRVVLPTGPSEDPTRPGNPTRWMLILCPVIVDNAPLDMIEVLQRPTSDAQLQQAYMNLLAAMGEAAADFRRNHLLRDLRHRQRDWQACQRFVRQVHDCTAMRETAYVLVHEGRRLLDVDRVSVALCCGRRCTLLAVSGVERIQRRSVSVRWLERMSALVAALREPLRFDGAGADLPPELETMLQAYLDETDVRSLVLYPLIKPTGEDETVRDPAHAAPVGVLIVEQFDAQRSAIRDAALETVAAHGEIALRAALHRRHWTSRVARWFGQSNRWLKASLITALLLSVVTTAAVVPADFRIQARGQLVPQRRQDVFAPRDGEIQILNVEHDDPVEPDQELARMVSADLELEIKRLLGEFETTQQKLRTVRAERVRASAPTAADRQAGASWSALEKELEKQQQSLRDQLAVVQAEEVRLSLRSPMRGRIQTWDLQRLLEARPVRQGQVLMTVADVDGPWELELEIPDHHIAHVLAAWQEQGEDVEVMFILKTDPETTYRGVLRKIGMTTVSDDRQQVHVQALVAIDREEIRWLRSGASVVARIDCGQRAILYVWLHDLIDTVRTWILF